VRTQRAHVVWTKEELTHHLLALVLAAVLVWYALVVPANASAKRVAGQTPDDAEHGGEVRCKDSAFDKGVSTEEAVVPVDELDWPEYIYTD
jgi:hypothetical protein